MARKEAKSQSQSSSGPSSSSRNLSPEDYRRAVAEAAYYRALERGFQGGDPMDDWLQAERDIQREQEGTQRKSG